MIVWNKVTWYSKLLAVIVLLVLFPALTFYIGMRYEEVHLLTMSDIHYVINNQEVDRAAFVALLSTLTLDDTGAIHGEMSSGGPFSTMPAHDASGHAYKYETGSSPAGQSLSITKLPS